MKELSRDCCLYICDIMYRLLAANKVLYRTKIIMHHINVITNPLRTIRTRTFYFHSRISKLYI